MSEDSGNYLLSLISDQTTELIKDPVRVNFTPNQKSEVKINNNEMNTIIIIIIVIIIVIIIIIIIIVAELFLMSCLVN